MEIIDRKPIPIYETICPECKSVLQYKKSELHLGGYLTCPVCGDTVWGSAIKPVKYIDNSEEMTNDNVSTIHTEKHGHWLFYEEPDGYYHSECSECGQWCDEDVFLKGKWHYCPNCGAKMDKDEWQEPEINPCRGCDDYDGQGGCKSNGGCMSKLTTTVNRGRWIKVEDDYNNHLYECSNCHTWTSLPTEEVNDGNIRYCWNCGAKMMR